jgi:hypothetical protein
MESSSSTPCVGSARADHEESTRWQNLALSRVPLCLPGAPRTIVLPVHDRLASPSPPPCPAPPHILVVHRSPSPARRQHPARPERLPRRLTNVGTTPNPALVPFVQTLDVPLLDDDRYRVAMALQTTLRWLIVSPMFEAGPGPASPPQTPRRRRASLLEGTAPVTGAPLVSQLGRWRERSCACSLLEESVIQRSCHDQSETSREATHGLQGRRPKGPHRSRWRRSRADVGRDSMWRQFRQYQCEWKGDVVVRVVG